MYDFEIGFQGCPAAVLKRTKETIEGDGGVFYADDSGVLFSVRTPVGRVNGSCAWAGPATIGVTITRKPFFVPRSAIKQQMLVAFDEASKSGVNAPPE